MQRLFACLILLSCSQFALAWGDEGHQVVAAIAWHFLTPNSQQQISALLQTDHSGLTQTDFVHESVWADVYRDSDRNSTKINYERTRRWHYINLDINHPDFNSACFGSALLDTTHVASQGRANACITDKIDQFAAELASKKTAGAERLLALQFLIHLLGDLHQPLHVSDNHDSGGNTVYVSLNQRTPITLHSYWDNTAVQLSGSDAYKLATDLISHAPASDLVRWRRGNSRDWALEGLLCARDIVYVQLRTADNGGVDTLDKAYVEKSKRAAKQQLIKGGVRLAEVLNRAFNAQ